nr:nucleoporin autopeptidase [Tanacetum cinerariifolium]
EYTEFASTVQQNGRPTNNCNGNHLENGFKEQPSLLTWRGIRMATMLPLRM